MRLIHRTDRRGYCIRAAEGATASLADGGGDAEDDDASAAIVPRLLWTQAVWGDGAADGHDDDGDSAKDCDAPGGPGASRAVEVREVDLLEESEADWHLYRLPDDHPAAAGAAVAMFAVLRAPDWGGGAPRGRLRCGRALRDLAARVEEDRERLEASIMQVHVGLALPALKARHLDTEEAVAEYCRECHREGISLPERTTVDALEAELREQEAKFEWTDRRIERDFERHCLRAEDLHAWLETVHAVQMYNGDDMGGHDPRDDPNSLRVGDFKSQSSAIGSFDRATGQLLDDNTDVESISSDKSQHLPIGMTLQSENSSGGEFPTPKAKQTKTERITRTFASSKADIREENDESSSKSPSHSTQWVCTSTKQTSVDRTRSELSSQEAETRNDVDRSTPRPPSTYALEGHGVCDAVISKEQAPMQQTKLENSSFEIIPSRSQQFTRTKQLGTNRLDAIAKAYEMQQQKTSGLQTDKTYAAIYPSPPFEAKEYDEYSSFRDRQSVLQFWKQKVSVTGTGVVAPSLPLRNLLARKTSNVVVKDTVIRSVVRRKSRNENDNSDSVKFKEETGIDSRLHLQQSKDKSCNLPNDDFKKEAESSAMPDCRAKSLLDAAFASFENVSKKVTCTTPASLTTRRFEPCVSSVQSLLVEPKQDAETGIFCFSDDSSQENTLRLSDVDDASVAARYFSELERESAAELFLNELEREKPLYSHLRRIEGKAGTSTDDDIKVDIESEIHFWKDYARQLATLDSESYAMI